jgi:hypothetical protein
LILNNPFELPTPPQDFDPDPEGATPPRPFDLRLEWMPDHYAASISRYVVAGLLDGASIAGRLWVERAQLEQLLRDLGHSSFDPADPFYIDPGSIFDHDRWDAMADLRRECW